MTFRRISFVKEHLKFNGSPNAFIGLLLSFSFLLNTLLFNIVFAKDTKVIPSGFQSYLERPDILSVKSQDQTSGFSIFSRGHLL